MWTSTRSDRPSRRLAPGALVWMWLVASAATLLAQGREQYLNFLAPPAKPLATVDVGGHDYLLVCNVPASRLEVWDLAGSTLTYATSVPTGLKPVSVAVKPTPETGGARMVYTANWLGDSITQVRLSDGGGSLQAHLVRTVRVGDEPVHLTFLPEYPAGHHLAPFSGVGAPFHEHLVAVFGTPGQWGVFDSSTLQPSKPASAAIDLKDLTQADTWAVKNPRHVATVPAGATGNDEYRMVVLARRGGQTPDTAAGDRPNLDLTPFDFDLWVTDDPKAAFQNGGAGTAVSGLGTTHFNMTIAPNGDIYVVGQKARNLSVPVSNEQGAGMPPPTGEELHRDQVVHETGFVRSMIWRVQQAGEAGEVVEARDLNEDLASPGSPVGYAAAVTQPTDVVVYGDGGPGSKVFVTGFASDNFAVIDVGGSGSSLSSWTVTPVPIDNPTPFLPPDQLDGRMKGPRSLTLLETGDPAEDRLLIYNWLDNTVGSVRVREVGTAPVTHVELLEVRPDYVLDGQGFLFASSLSANRSVSCASCHIDGGTDGLAWNLSDGKDLRLMSTGELGNPDPACTPNPNLPPGVLIENSGFKGPMVTQNLHGLVNFEVGDQKLQDLLSNKPYHWRGDRGDFTQFNGAFANLMAIPSPHSQTEGIHPDDMDRYKLFVNSIHYPPNPEQPADRRYSGTFADAEPNNVEAGTLAQRGLKLFHLKPYRASSNRTCVGCHTLPAGSNTVLTVMFAFWAHGYGPTGPPIVRDQSLETAALRFLIAKEKRLYRFDAATETLIHDGAVTANSGLIHTGADTAVEDPSVPKFGPLPAPEDRAMDVLEKFSDSIFDFIKTGGGIGTHEFGNLNDGDVSSLALYVRQFDTGVAPSIGLPLSVDAPAYTSDPAGVEAEIQRLEGYANEVNAGLVVYVEDDGVGRRGYYYDPLTELYVEVPVAGIPPTGNLARSGVLDLLTGAGVEVFQAVPLGSELRLADLDPEWDGTLPSGSQPGPVILEGMVPNTANRDIPLMNDPWNTVVRSSSAASKLRAKAYFEQAGIEEGGAAVPMYFGLSADARHDAPRRFRVRSSGVVFGARLRLTAANNDDLATIPVGSPDNTPPAAPPDPGQPHGVIVLDLHPGRDAEGPYLETHVELGDALYLALMMGYANHPKVRDYYQDPCTLPADPLVYLDDLDPMGNNWFYAEIENGGTTGGGSWQRLYLQ